MIRADVGEDLDLLDERLKDLEIHQGSYASSVLREDDGFALLLHQSTNCGEAYSATLRRFGSASEYCFRRICTASASKLSRTFFAARSPLSPAASKVTA